MATHTQCSCLESPTDRGAWRATVSGVTKADATSHLACTHAYFTDEGTEVLASWKWASWKQQNWCPGCTAVRAHHEGPFSARARVFSHAPLFVTPWTIAPTGASVHGISQARILEWVAIFSSRGTSGPRDWTWVSGIGRWILYHWAIREAPILGTAAVM